MKKMLKRTKELGIRIVERVILIYLLLRQDLAMNETKGLWEELKTVWQKQWFLATMKYLILL